MNPPWSPAILANWAVTAGVPINQMVDEMIACADERSGGNYALAAKALGVAPRTIYRRLPRPRKQQTKQHNEA